MRICIDSGVFIRAFDESNSFALQILRLINPGLDLMIPGLVANEVRRNLKSNEQVRRFYHLFHKREFAQIVYEPVPSELFAKYVALGLRAKGDAYIGAFAEWVGSQYLISANRHFLRELRTGAFEVVEAQEFIRRWDAGLDAQAQSSSEEI
jgi:hypothetical protein